LIRGECFLAPGECFLAPGECFLTPGECFLSLGECFLTPGECFLRALLRLKPSRMGESMGHYERYAMPHRRVNALRARRLGVGECFLTPGECFLTPGECFLS
jgi:hypothetical protein